MRNDAVPFVFHQQPTSVWSISMNIYVKFEIAVAHGFMVLAIDFVVVEHLAGSFLLAYISFFHVPELLLISLYSSLEFRNFPHGNSSIAYEFRMDWLGVGTNIMMWKEGSLSLFCLLLVGLKVGVFDEHLCLHSNHYNGERPYSKGDEMI